MTIKELFETFTTDVVNVKCQISSIRFSKTNIFIEATDGSSPDILYIYVSKDIDSDRQLKIGEYIYVEGKMQKVERKHKMELLAFKLTKISHTIKEASAIEISERQLPLLMTHDADLSTIRDKHDIRSSHPKYRSIFRIRSNLIYAITHFFYEKDIQRLDPNIFTSGDCEGAGEIFYIQQGKKIVKHDDVEVLVPKFFHTEVGLTVSSQLQLEALVRTYMGGVWTFNPSFRAEESQTRRHLAHFTHLEWERMFTDLTDLMDFSEELVVYLWKFVLDKCIKDLDLLEKCGEIGLISKLKSFTELSKFKRITYTEAIDLVSTKSIEINEYFGDKSVIEIPKWGDDLGSYCERYISEKIFESPTFITDYPSTLKSFYMKQNEDGKTVSCCDLLVPYLGELIGSSMREPSYDKLIKSMDDKSIKTTPIQWYVDLRKFDSILTGGAGLGFERLIATCTTCKEGNIRDMIPFPSAYGDTQRF